MPWLARNHAVTRTGGRAESCILSRHGDRAYPSTNVGCLYDLRSPLAAHIQTLVRKEELAQNSGIGFLGNGRMTGHVAYLVHGWRHTSSRGSVPPICAHRDFFAFKRNAEFCSVWRTCLRAFDVSFVALVGFHRATAHPSKEGALRWTIRIATAVEHPTDVARRCWCRIHSLDIDVCRSVPEAARESLDRGAVASRSAAVERRMGLLPQRGSCRVRGGVYLREHNSRRLSSFVGGRFGVVG